MAVGYPTPQILEGGAIGEERCVHPCCLTWEFIPTAHGCPWHLAQWTLSWHVPIHTPVPFFSLVFSLSFFFPISNQNKNKNAPSFMKLPEKHSRMELGCQGLQDAYQPLVQFCSLQPTWGEAKGGKLGWVPMRAACLGNPCWKTCNGWGCFPQGEPETNFTRDWNSLCCIPLGLGASLECWGLQQLALNVKLMWNFALGVQVAYLRCPEKEFLDLFSDVGVPPKRSLFLLPLLSATDPLLCPLSSMLWVPTLLFPSPVFPSPGNLPAPQSCCSFNLFISTASTLLLQ